MLNMQPLACHKRALKWVLFFCCFHTVHKTDAFLQQPLAFSLQNIASCHTIQQEVLRFYSTPQLHQQRELSFFIITEQKVMCSFICKNETKLKSLLHNGHKSVIKMSVDNSMISLIKILSQTSLESIQIHIQFGHFASAHRFK